MHPGLRLLLIFTFLATFSHGQTPVPVSTYTLHAEKLHVRWTLTGAVTPPSSVFALAPDNALLVLIPQPDKQWVLKRITGWDAPQPQEQTLAFVADQSHDNRAWIFKDLTVDSGGNYLIARVAIRHNGSSHGRNRQAIVILIDLRTFSIVWRRETTDPLIATSHWNFNKDGLLIAKGLEDESINFKKSSYYEYEAAALSWPDLKPTLPCRYKVVNGPYPAYPGFPSRSITQESDTCTSLLSAANVSSPEELPGSYREPESIAKLAGPSCRFTALTKAEKFALYSCSTGYPTWWDTYKTTSRAETVLSVADGKTILSVPLPFEQEVLATLATNGQDFLVLVRDGIKLETYRLP
jgi:hypothetical protein